MTFEELFGLASERARPGISPHEWQAQAGGAWRCENRLSRIPTGFGKTLGVLTAWLWNRLERADEWWPRRLIWCLPMRVLVEQTESEVRRVLGQLGWLWEGGDHGGKVGVHLLMGGTEDCEWYLHPEHCAVLIGTQDMLISRALNRGYASPRARWPMEFGLLNTMAMATALERAALRIAPERRNGELWNRVAKPCRVWRKWRIKRAELDKWIDAQPSGGDGDRHSV